MKLIRTLSVMVVLLGFATAGHADPESSEAKMKVAKGDIAATLEANERKVNDAIKKKDTAAAMALIDAAGWMADPSGIHPTSAMPEMMKDWDVRSYTIEDYKAMMIDKDAYVATYVWRADASYKGQVLPQMPVYCSTVWV